MAKFTDNNSTRNNATNGNGASISQEVGRYTTEQAAYQGFTVNPFDASQEVTVTYAYDDEGQQKYLSSGDTTDDTTPFIKGKAAAYAVVNIEDNGQMIGSVVSGYDGSWVFHPINPLAAGPHALVFKTNAAESQPFIVNIDPPKVVVNFVYDDEGQHQYLTNGAATDDLTPYFQGKAQSNTLITVLDNGKVIGSVMSSYSGSWNFRPTSNIAAGKHAFEFKTATSTSDVFELTVVTPAGLPITVYNAIDDVNGYTYIQQGGKTDDNKPTFSGSAGPNSVVYAYENGVQIGSASTGGSGFWNITPATALKDGQHSVIFSTDSTFSATGNNSKPFDLTVATATAPVVGNVEIEWVRENVSKVGFIKEKQTTDDDTLTYKGKASPFALVKFYVDGVFIGQKGANAAGSWEFTSTAVLANGNHTFEAKISGQSTGASFEFNLEVPVRFTGLIAADGAYIGEGATSDDKDFRITGYGPRSAIINVYDNDVLVGSVKTTTSGYWSLGMQDLADGAHSIVAKAGAVASPAYEFTTVGETVLPPVEEKPVTLDMVIDNVGTQTNLKTGETTDDAKPTLKGKAEAGARVDIYDNGILIGSIIASAKGDWSFEPARAINEGKHVITVKSGTTTSAEFEFTVALPTSQQSVIDWVRENASKTGFIKHSATTDDDTLTFHGTSQPNSSVVFYIDGKEVGMARAGANGSWEFTPKNAVANGEHIFTAKAAVETDGVSFNFNVEVPLRINDVLEVDFTHIGNGSESSDADFVINGRGPRDVIVKLYDGETLLGSVKTSAGTGSWTMKITGLTTGAHDLVAKFGDYVSESYEFTTVGATPVDPEEGVSATLNLVFDDFNQIGSVNQSGQIIKHGGATRSYQPTFSGRAEANSVVVIYDNKTAIGSTLSNAAGEWSFKPTQSLSGEQHSITVAGANGQQSEAFDYTLVARLSIAVGIEDDVGLGQFDSYGNNVITDSRPEFIGQGVAGSIITLELNGTTVGSTLVDAAGSWHFRISDHLKYVYGGYELIAKSAGLLSSLPFDFEIKHPEDTDINFGKAYSDNDGLVQIVNTGSTDDTTPLFHGTAGFDVVVQFFDNGVAIGSTQAGPDGKWTFQPELAVGAHSLSAKDGGYKQTYLDFKINITASVKSIAVVAEDVLNDASEALHFVDVKEEMISAPLILEQQDLSFSSSQGISAEQVQNPVQPLEDDTARF